MSKLNHKANNKIALVLMHMGLAVLSGYVMVGCGIFGSSSGSDGDSNSGGGSEPVVLDEALSGHENEEAIKNIIEEFPVVAAAGLNQCVNLIAFANHYIDVCVAEGAGLCANWESQSGGFGQGLVAGDVVTSSFEHESLTPECISCFGSFENFSGGLSDANEAKAANNVTLLGFEPCGQAIEQ